MIYLRQQIWLGSLFWKHEMEKLKQNRQFWNDDILDDVLMWPQTSCVFFSVCNFIPQVCSVSNNFGCMWDRPMIFKVWESLTCLLSYDVTNSIFYFLTYESFCLKTSHISFTNGKAMGYFIWPYASNASHILHLFRWITTKLILPHLFL